MNFRAMSILFPWYLALCFCTWKEVNKYLFISLSSIKNQKDTNGSILYTQCTFCFHLTISNTLFWRRKWQPTPVLLPGEFHGQRNLVGCCPWGSTELDMTEATLHACMHALEKEMTTHFSILAWRIPGTEEPGGLPSMGSHRVGHSWSNLAAAAAT